MRIVTYPPMPSLPDGPKSIQVIDELIVAQRAKRQEQFNRGLNIPLMTTIGRETSIVGRFYELPDEVTFKGRTYVKVGAAQLDGRPYAHYWLKGLEFPTGTLVSKAVVSHAAILAEYLFGITHAGLDSYLAEFGKFIGVHLDSNNMPDYLHAFSAYLCKEMEVDPRMVKLVVKYVMHLK